MAITKPYTFQAGTKARASEVNQDFDILYSEVNRIGTEILNIDIEIQNVAEGKADINGNAGQVFKMADAVDSYDGVNKNVLENSIANIKDYISGFIIYKDTNTSIRVSSGSCYDSTFTVVITSTGNITKENTIQGAGTRYVHVISDDAGRQADVLISSQSIDPALPSGYTKYRLVGSFVTNSSNQITSISYFGNASNVNNSAFNKFYSIMPKYGSQINKATNVTHTATEQGWVFLYADSYNNRRLSYTINGTAYSLTGNYNSDTDTSGAGIWFMVSVGDTYYFSSDGARGIQFRFYPLRGGV